MLEGTVFLAKHRFFSTSYQSHKCFVQKIILLYQYNIILAGFTANKMFMNDQVALVLLVRNWFYAIFFTHDRNVCVVFIVFNGFIYLFYYESC